MESPFPGMNPFLEAPAMWPDVHHELIAIIRDQIQSKLSAGYRAVITPYLSFESIEIAPIRRVVPDVAIVEREPFATGASTALAVETAPLTLPALMTVPVEYARIEIRTVRDQVLVTAIELLSPANKRPGIDGADAYEKKRQELFSSTAHLLEIDLLRAGTRPQVARALPQADYFVFLSRVQRRPQIEIWPLSMRDAIKLVPVPLRYPDPPIALDIGTAIHESYRRARYDLEIDYREPPPPPALSAEDAAWLDDHLRTKGLRD
jgi:PIN domain nuclease of toxin-antitoxin system